MSANYLKKQLRQKMCEKRQALTKGQQKLFSQELAHQVSKHTVFKKSQNIAFYESHNGEINPEILRLEAINHGKSCYLPVLHPNQGNKLVFAKIDEYTEYTKNKYGISEPNLETCRIVPPWHLDLIMMPLVAFDQNRNRLGMGGGYYDRTLAFKHKRQGHTILLGLAYSFQQVNFVPHNNRDVRLDAVATEKYFFLKQPKT